MKKCVEKLTNMMIGVKKFVKSYTALSRVVKGNCNPFSNETPRLQGNADETDIKNYSILLIRF